MVQLAGQRLFTGSPENDVVSGTGAGDYLFGDRGNDTLSGLSGTDILRGYTETTFSAAATVLTASMVGMATISCSARTAMTICAPDPAAIVWTVATARCVSGGVGSGRLDRRSGRRHLRLRPDRRQPGRVTRPDLGLRPGRPHRHQQHRCTGEHGRRPTPTVSSVVPASRARGSSGPPPPVASRWWS